MLARTLGFVAITAAIVLAGCGGGSTPGTGGVQYPDCSLGVNGTSDLAGCWVSERCATNPELAPGETRGPASLRLLEHITQDSVSPTVSGSIRPFMLKYTTPDCSGAPYSVEDMTASAQSQGLIWRLHYEELGFSLCGDLADSSVDDISCMRMNVDSFYQYNGGTPLTTEGDVYYRADVTSRLCLDVGTFNFDDTGSGGINPGNGPLSDPILDLETGHCLTRFMP